MTPRIAIRVFWNPDLCQEAELATAVQAARLKWLFVAPEFLHLALATVESLGLPPSMVVVFDPPGLDAYRGTQASLSNIIDGVDEASSRNTNEEKDATTREAFRFFTSGSTGSAKAATISHRASAVRVDFVAAMPLLDKPFLLVIGMFHGHLVVKKPSNMFRKILPDKARVNTGYGTTEVAGLSSGIIDDNWVTGCVGQVPSSTAVKIVYFDTLQEVPPGAVGEVCARSAAAFSGYYNSAAATERAFLPGEPGWFRTGDKGVMDPESRVLTLLGRFKEIFKVRCKEVAPAEVECVFLQNGDITDALVTLPTHW
ncbi:hypothetical protein MY11210_002321 [Beauveria gryllotalpidicola]